MISLRTPHGYALLETVIALTIVLILLGVLAARHANLARFEKRLLTELFTDQRCRTEEVICTINRLEAIGERIEICKPLQTECTHAVYTRIAPAR